MSRQLFSCWWSYSPDRADFEEMEIEDTVGDFASIAEAFEAACRAMAEFAAEELDLALELTFDDSVQESAEIYREVSIPAVGPRASFRIYLDAVEG